jgi:hypothetical protein
MNPTEPQDDLVRLIHHHPHRWTTEAVELALVFAAVEDMEPGDWLRWLDDLSLCLSGARASMPEPWWPASPWGTRGPSRPTSNDTAAHHR